MYDKLMKFLDLAIKTTKEHAKELRDLNEKQIYCRHADKLTEARRTFLKEYHTFSDYLETGEYKVPVIKFTVLETPVKTI